MHLEGSGIKDTLLGRVKLHRREITVFGPLSVVEITMHRETPECYNNGDNERRDPGGAVALPF